MAQINEIWVVSMNKLVLARFISLLSFTFSCSKTFWEILIVRWVLWKYKITAIRNWDKRKKNIDRKIRWIQGLVWTSFSRFKGDINLVWRLIRWESKERNSLCYQILCPHSFAGGAGRVAQEKPDFSVAETLERLVPWITIERVPHVQKGAHLQQVTQGQGSRYEKIW